MFDQSVWCTVPVRGVGWLRYIQWSYRPQTARFQSRSGYEINQSIVAARGWGSKYVWHETSNGTAVFIATDRISSRR